MFTKDLSAHLTVTALVQPGNKTTTQTSAALDIIDYEGDLLVLQSVGTLTAGTCAGTIEDSADGATGWAAVSGATFAAVAANQLQELKLDKRSCKRYVRYVGTLAGGPDMNMAVIIAGQLKRQ
ncbi:MAG: hypothetical protein QOF48_1738 [Verrucomicrobiota bacterium]|jgi:hypothetical protein